MIVSSAFAGKRYAILGLARSGLAAAEALLASGAEVVAWDRQDVAREKLAGRAELSDPLELDLTGFDGVIVSPGVPINTHPIAGHAEKYGVPVIGDIELFALARPSLPSHKVVGITGTNGKSTTTALVSHVLEEVGIPVRMGGNIGVPILGEESLPSGGVYVLELSSYQIDLTLSLACDAAALLNITPDHLDRYDDFASYAASKARLFAMQHADQFAVFGTNDPQTNRIAEVEAARRPEGRVKAADQASIAEGQADWPALQGPHNLENAAVAVALLENLGVQPAQWGDAFKSFRGLPHRMEVVGEHDGVLFINDSKATNQASAAPALAAYPANPAPRVHWIVGGLAKEDGLGACEQYLGNVKGAYTIGESGPNFAEMLDEKVAVEKCELLCEAVTRAIANAEAGDIILLSPACASFDQFRDYEKRGEHFCQIVSAIAEAGEAS
ncbi:UDP-N-acetylmuramoyl-L-alanine--D-glutamate ligase [Pontixanthobacter gangjinensis]|uniref:UDP-N-acetylmuramoylalanine--D-glutamate ligase n=1 Tax=Pontixanthobacter gangjinensis TaxID=1028742 RepID=A0A6I4SL43_9SPHN|nr:UDP-N-acetylmuramoyl-L-alanine--D-glutamate ligase [Pontixanthobacter gangjinensis]MXO56435.1 UDP-N-acetylmuramoyl-L-alanine--D-glutamate ligase [Pontixanthobacter gangjinensis]